MYVPMCNRFHARRRKMTAFLRAGGLPLFDALVRGESLHPAARKVVTKNESLAPCGSLQWRFHHPKLRRFDTIQQCDRQTDRRTDASAVAKTRLALHAVARKID